MCVCACGVDDAVCVCVCVCVCGVGGTVCVCVCGVGGAVFFFMLCVSTEGHVCRRALECKECQIISKFARIDMHIHMEYCAVHTVDSR